MKIIDIYPNPSKGLFTEVFKKEYPQQYVQIFGTLSSEGLDTLVLLNYSERECLNTITKDNANEYVKNVIALSVESWVRVANAYNTKYDILNPVSQTKTRTDNTTESENNNATNITSNKPFNESEFEEYDKDDNTSDKTRSNKVESTETISGLNGKSVTEELQKEIEFSLQNYRKSIIFAIINDITKSIY